MDVGRESAAMSQHPRRSSTIPVAAPDTIPRAPPLPAPRPLQRARDAAYRFFGTPSRAPSPIEEHQDGRFTRGGIARYASLGATQNATASHKTGLEINTIAINEKGTHALIGGKEIFKTVKVEEGVCAEELNLRTAIRSTPTQASGGPRQIYSIDIADVAWAKGDCGDYVAAATSSGKIILYDLGHAGLQAAQLHEHYRQVHKVTFNPHRGNLLLSGSQDGTVRLWDLRDLRNEAKTLQSKRKYSGQTDGVRDVKWSPTEGVDFAFGTDSGWIQRWDMRNLKTAKVKIAAHSLTCNTIDWHPDGKHLVSASSDKMIRVWDFSTSRRQAKSSWEIKTPYPVLNARWRPSCESAMPHDNGARQCTQLVTSYDREHPVLHIWDFRRPSLPFREMVPYPSAPTDLLWHSQDLLWTVGREGVFLQSDIQHAPKVIAKRNLQALAISPSGEINFVVQKRKQKRVPRKLEHPPQELQSKSSSLSQSPEHSFLSRSWADDSIDHSFLSVSPAKGHRRSGSKGRVMSVSATQPFDQSMVSTIKLDDILLNRRSFRPDQSAVRGLLPGYRDREVFRYLAKEYIMSVPLASEVDAVHQAFQSNAEHAEEVGLYRLAQTWRIVGFVVLEHLKEREDAKRHQAFTGKLHNLKEKPRFSDVAKQLPVGTTKSTTATAALPPTSNLAKALAAPESTSNVPTPLIRPQDHTATALNIPPKLETHSSNESFEFLASLDSKAPYLSTMESEAEVRDDRLGYRSRSRSPDIDDAMHGLVGAYGEYDMPALSGVPTRRCSLEQPTNDKMAAQDGNDAVFDSKQLKDNMLHQSPPMEFFERRVEDTSDAEIDVEANKPFTLQAMLTELVKYYSDNLPDAQTAAHLLLLVEPLLPETHKLSQATTVATIASYTDCLTANGWDEDDTADLIDDCFTHPILAGLIPLQIEAILSSYHEQLLQQRLFDEAANIRRLCYPKYPAVYEQALKDIDIKLTPGEDASICPVCRCKNNPYDLGKDERYGAALFSSCLICGHSGHAACLETWFSGDTGCPTEGCLCDCGSKQA